MPVSVLRTVKRSVLGKAEGSAQIATKAADQSNSTTTGADVTDLIIPIGPTQIINFHAYLVCSAAAVTTGIQLAVNGPASPTQVEATIIGWTDATTRATDGVSAYETYQANASSPGTTRRVFEIFGRVINGTTRGTLAMRFRSEVGASAVTVYKGSWVGWHRETQQVKA